MSYNFKNLADVELLAAMPEDAKVLVEVDGATRRAPKEDGIGKLVSVEALEEVPEGATVLAEVNGEIKRVPGEELGGSKTIIFHVPSENVTVCNYSPAEVHELMLARASSMLTLDFAAMNGGGNPTVLADIDSSVVPIIMRMPSFMDAPMSDGSSYFMFNFDGTTVNIAYYPDGTIENSLFEVSEET